MANPDLTLTCPQDIDNRPNWDTSSKTPPEMKRLLSACWMGALKPRALWSAGGTQLRDYVRCFSTSLLV